MIEHIDKISVVDNVLKIKGFSTLLIPGINCHSYSGIEINDGYTTSDGRCHIVRIIPRFEVRREPSCFDTDWLIVWQTSPGYEPHKLFDVLISREDLPDLMYDDFWVTNDLIIEVTNVVRDNEKAACKDH